MLRKFLRTVVTALVLLSACLTMVANARAETGHAGDRPIPITSPDPGRGR